MPRGGKPAHVITDLRDDDLRGSGANSRNRGQPFDGVLKRGQGGLDTGVEGGNAFLQLLDRSQMLGQQKTMMLADATSKRLHESRSRAAQSFAAERGELGRIRLARDHGLQDAPSAGTQNIRDH